MQKKIADRLRLFDRYVVGTLSADRPLCCWTAMLLTAALSDDE